MTSYSEAELIKDLKEWWDEETASLEDPFAEPQDSEHSIEDQEPPVDSLAMVKKLVTIEKHVGFDLPICIVQRGGYKSFEEMLAQLLPRIREEAVKHGKMAA